MSMRKSMDHAEMAKALDADAEKVGKAVARERSGTTGASSADWMQKTDAQKKAREAAHAKYIKAQKDFKDDPYMAFDEGEEWVVECLDWVRAVTGEKLENGVTDLRDGKILCKLINRIDPGTIQVINKCTHTKTKDALLCMENIKFFIDGCLTIGVSSNDLFQPGDLYGGMNKRQVIICLAALGRVTFNVKSYKGPVLGKGLSQSYMDRNVLDEEVEAKVQARLDDVAAARGEKVEKAKEYAEKRKNDAYSGSMEVQVRKWSEDVVGEKWSSDDMWEALNDGFFLGKLANAIIPGSVNIKKLKKSKIAFMRMENIGYFCTAVKKMGVKPSEQFRPPDLYEKGSSYPKQINICLWALGHACEDIKGYKGPHLNR